MPVPSDPPAQRGGDGPIDLLVIGGSILTLDDARPEVEAVAMRQGVITALGDAAKDRALRGPSTVVVDLRGGLAVPGLTGILVGPNDLAGSMGLMGKPEHPDVVHTMETIVAKARATNVWASVSVGGGPEVQAQWIQRGVKWLTVGDDLGFMSQAARQMLDGIRVNGS